MPPDTHIYIYTHTYMYTRINTYTYIYIYLLQMTQKQDLISTTTSISKELTERGSWDRCLEPPTSHVHVGVAQKGVAFSGHSCGLYRLLGSENTSHGQTSLCRILSLRATATRLYVWNLHPGSLKAPGLEQHGLARKQNLSFGCGGLCCPKAPGCKKTTHFDVYQNGNPLTFEGSEFCMGTGTKAFAKYSLSC